MITPMPILTQPSGGGGDTIGCSGVSPLTIPTGDKTAVFESTRLSNNYSSYQTMFTLETGNSPVSIEVESWFLYNGVWQSTGAGGYNRKYIIDGVETSIPNNPNKETITIPANKTCAVQQTTSGNNYTNGLRFQFK